MSEEVLGGMVSGGEVGAGVVKLNSGVLRVSLVAGGSVVISLPFVFIVICRSGEVLTDGRRDAQEDRRTQASAAKTTFLIILTVYLLEL